MAQIILDMGSGNTCHNSTVYIKSMLEAVSEIDTKRHEIIMKWQLFKTAGNNIPLSHKSFKYAFDCAKSLGYQTTSSVFDEESLNYLLKFDIPFVKISCNKHNYKYIYKVPIGIKKYVSYTYHESQSNIENEAVRNNADVMLACIPKYPSLMVDYENRFSESELKRAISDHSNNLDLYYKYLPNIVEWHFKLPDSVGLDAGEFARTPKQLRNVL